MLSRKYYSVMCKLMCPSVTISSRKMSLVRPKETYLDPKRKRLQKEKLINISSQLVDWVKKEPSEPNWFELKERYIKENPTFFNKYNFEVQFMQFLTHSEERDQKILNSFASYIEQLLAEKPNKVILAHYLVFLMENCDTQSIDIDKTRRLMEEVTRDEKFCRYPAVGNAWIAFAALSRQNCIDAVKFCMNYESSAWNWGKLGRVCFKYGLLDEGFDVFKHKVSEISDEVAGELLEIFENYPEEITRLINLFNHKQYYFPSECNLLIGEFLRKLGLEPVKVTINFKNGQCNNCNSILETFDEHECATLRDHLREKVLIPDGNVYIKTTPREIQLFNEMLESRKDRPFDLVIDALNCSYWASERQLVTDPTTNRIIPTNLGLKESLHEILERGKIFHRFHSILVVGRKHMSDWKSIEMFRERPSQVEIFLLDNASDDDVFMLYASLQNPQTRLISQDYMRQHASLLEPEIQRLFQKWKRCRMIRMKYKKATRIFYPQGVDYVCQTNDHHLHIPINISEAYDKDEIFMIRWWCAALPSKESQNISDP